MSLCRVSDPAIYKTSASTLNIGTKLFFITALYISYDSDTACALIFSHKKTHANLYSKKLCPFLGQVTTFLEL